ncbi:DUF2917 domain-containing protein [Geomonas sp. Red69]|uniref:DUF2917 domain-containing protein n=1 Tax=Geomonas diazotrophica TaxID=2843197 RepID=A0ABX8JJ28_9BACT|nr:MULTISPECIES: DUF2917 domain-containing protein [Geomonas]MBU5638325.1 DUF2917 domain-containing protein [Geomonas diazotrophica]QWV96672.1 DUF2917 domain-containing protein [Geomonas nitrogeniifigens]QXE85775.1 DUF2917 domain-containing protein [Geomonas nitrogeniifigens]
MECSLGKGELLSLTGGAHGLTLRCLIGTIWLTKGDGRDYLVRQGNSFELSKGESALAEALEAAELQVRAAGVTRGSRSTFAAQPAGPFLPRLL